jgi:CheY-like chemotaxis protein
LLRTLLEEVGFDVRTAKHGREALDQFESWNPELIWMDMRMPVMDGYVATRRIKEHARGGQTVVVALTASAFEEDREQVLAAGCDDFVRKPLTIDVILGKMKEHLGVQYEPLRLEESRAVVSVDRDALKRLPAALFQALSAAVTELDLQRIKQVIAEITTIDRDLGFALDRLAREFRLEELNEYIKG